MFYLLVHLFVCLFALLGLACLAWGVSLPLLALLVIAGVVQRCLFSAWRYLALFGFAGVGFAGVAGRCNFTGIEVSGKLY